MTIHQRNTRFSKTLNLSLAFLLVLAIASFRIGHIAAASQIWYVNHAATGANNGSSWEDAFSDLQTALATAQAGDEIWVAQGVYYPTTNPSEREKSFELKNQVALYGGFVGNETLRGQRDWESNKTILSGDIDQNDTHSDGIVSDASDIVGANSHHVVQTVQVDATTILDGFVITAGQANDSEPLYDELVSGGGIRNEGSKVTLNNLTLSGNFATFSGGGILNWGGSVQLSNSTFIGNHAEQTGGGLADFSSNSSLYNLVFTKNTAVFSGGGFTNRGNPERMEKLVFIDNQAEYGGGLDLEGSYPINNLYFSGNQADYGGAMYTQRMSSAYDMSNTVFVNNHAKHGGAMYNSMSSPTMINVDFIENSAEDGGAIYNSLQGSSSDSSPLIINSKFIANTASNHGGAIYNQGSKSELFNTSFSGNYAIQQGGAIYNLQSHIQLVNATITGNKADTSGAALYNNNSSPAITSTVIWNNGNTAFINDNNSSPNIGSSLIQGCNAGTWNTACGNDKGNNLSDSDPQFIQALDPSIAPSSAGDFHLQASSPLIDKGQFNFLFEVLPIDLSNSPRIYGSSIDIGAYEYQLYNLSTNTVGKGSVTRNPATGPYAYQSTVELTAVPDENWSFVGWSGASTSNSPTITIAISATHTITATFRSTILLADAGSDQIVAYGSEVTLDGSASSDPNPLETLSYGWSQTGGPSVELSDSSAMQPTFTAPTTDTVLSFSLVVTNSLGIASEPDIVNITVVESLDSSIFLPFVQRTE